MRFFTSIFCSFCTSGALICDIKYKIVIRAVNWIWSVNSHTAKVISENWQYFSATVYAYRGELAFELNANLISDLFWCLYTTEEFEIFWIFFNDLNKQYIACRRTIELVFLKDPDTRFNPIFCALRYFQGHFSRG